MANYISKIQLPSGTTYDIKDASAWSAISALTGIQFTVAWNGTSTPNVANIPAGVTVVYNDTEYTGTKTAASANTGTFYLVYSETQTGAPDAFDEYVVVTNGSSKQWELIGNTQVNLSDLGALAFKDSVALGKSTATVLTGAKLSAQPTATVKNTATDKVLGVDTTFTVTKPNVTVTCSSTKLGASVSGGGVTSSSSNFVTGYSSPTTDVVLGEGTTFTTSVTPTTTNIKATASGGIVKIDSSFAAVTGYSNPTTKNALGTSATFTTSVTPSTTKLSASASGGAVAIDSSFAAITGFGTHTTANVLGAGATFSTTANPSTNTIKATATGGGYASPTNSVEFVKSYPGATSKLVKTSASKVAEGTGQTTATGAGTASSNNADWLKGATYDSATETLTFGAATLNTQTTKQYTITDVSVATGALANNGAGDSVMTGLGTATTATAITALGTFTNPTISIGNGTGTGSYTVVTGIKDVSTKVNSKDQQAAITALGTPTTDKAVKTISMTQPSVTISSGTTGNVTVATGITSATTEVDATDTVAAITALGTASTQLAVKTISMTQPTIALATGATAGTGVISVATGITSATTSADTNDKVTALTGLGSASTSKALVSVSYTNPTVTITKGDTGDVSVLSGVTAALASTPSVTVGTNDQVDAVTAVGDVSISKITITSDGTATVLKSDSSIVIS